MRSINAHVTFPNKMLAETRSCAFPAKYAFVKGFSGLTGRLQHPVDFQCVKCKNWVFKVEPIKKFVRHKNVSLECADEF
jgi:hypothetical protein